MKQVISTERITPKERYFKKVYDMADEIECDCGCGEKIRNKDRYGREKRIISGHNGRKYEDATQYKREWNHRNRPARAEAKQERGYRLKAKMINIKGGRCQVCELAYTGKNACVFQFHHRNTAEKMHSITVRTLVHYAWDTMLAEVKKCDLFCANCHFVKHGAEY